MQLKALAAAFGVLVLVPACTIDLNVNDTQLLGSAETEEDRILAVLAAQQAAWNAGDIDGFMQGYWQSPQLRFASGGDVTRGWQDTRDRYHRRYGDTSKMGTLTFSDLEIVRIGFDDAVVHGAWALARAEDRPRGLFTLVMEKMDGDWKVVSDTTTSAD